ncbi:MAG: hypothetical protein K2F99_04860, partial [Muribaculaceae bacterium]|nr:hypothetical protein [Muribaculaceae bacterium]
MAVIVIGLVVALVVSIVDAMSSTGSRSDDIKYPTYNVIQESLIETASCSEFEAQMLVNWIQVAASNNKQEYDVYFEVNMSGCTNAVRTRWTIDLYTP